MLSNERLIGTVVLAGPRCQTARCRPRTVQGDAFNRSALRTTVVVPLTSNLRWADAPGNVLLSRRATGVPRDSVANVSRAITLDRSVLMERVGKLPRAKLDLVLAGLDVLFAR